MRLARWAALAVAMACAGFGASGCEGDSAAPPAPAPPAPPAAETTDVKVYLMRGEQIGVATRTVPQTTAVARAALTELLAGPTAAEQAAGLGTTIPAGTRLRDVSVAGGVATVDLSREFESGGGSLSMLLRVAEVVYTLTQFPTVERVAFRLDGEPATAIGGEGIIVDPPVGRADFEGQAPAILVESPAVGDVVSSPLRIRGSANTFEAVFQVNVVDWDGRIVADEVVTATSGTGTRGTFDVTVPFEIEAGGPPRLTLIAFEASAKDGSPIHVVEIPLELAQ